MTALTLGFFHENIKCGHEFQRRFRFAMTTETLPHKPSSLSRNLFFGISPATLLVIMIMLLSLALHLVNIGNIGDANAYYTAAVKSMLQSWHNFFYAAAEPGGSVSLPISLA